MCACLLAGSVHVALAASGNASADRVLAEKPETWLTLDGDRTAAVLEIPQDQQRLDAEESRSFSLPLDAAGDYYIALTYRTERELIIKNDVTVTAGGQSCVHQIYTLWQDATKEYSTDRFGNESPAGQTALDMDVTDYVRPLTSIDKSPFEFPLRQGLQEITLKNSDEPLFLKKITIVRTEPVAQSVQNTAPGSDFIVIEGEDYSAKSDSYIRGGAVRNEALYPYDYKVQKINVLDGSSFNTAGQKVLYAFRVEHAGVYRIGFRYSQSAKEGIPNYANIEIDGRQPRDLRGVAFAFTDTAYENITLPTGVYLEEGTHTIAIALDGAPLKEAVDGFSAIMKEVSDLGLEIKKLSGTLSSKNRSWNVEDYLPGVIDTLNGYKAEMERLYARLGALQDENPAAAVNAKLAIGNLEKAVEEPGKLPQNLSLLNEGSGSVTQLLADLIDKLSGQSLSVDRIYIYDGQRELPQAKSGVVTSFVNSVKRFFNTLLGGQDELTSEDELVVWMNRPIHYMEILQTMCDTTFTKQTGIRVRLALMPSEQKIILSNATDTAPDVAIGLGVNAPYDLGLRGAVTDLTQFDDFADYIQKEYDPELLNPYIHEKKIFGVTETQEFYVLCYRRDILEKLHISVPQTWSDVADLMPVLRRNSMDFYLQLSGWSGTKPLYATLPFLVQAGASPYAEDGLSPAINSEEAMKGFETLTDLYRLYNVPKNVSSFYNSFRYGQIPIGIASFTDYVKIKNAAPEIANLWEIAPSPGTLLEDGSIQRGTTAAASACAIMESSDKKNEGWEFLKWWLDSGTQVEFANSLQTTFGPEYLWNSANKAAFANLTFPEKDKKVIQTQWEQTFEIHRHPALYSIERELSTAWSHVVLDGQSPRIALDNAASVANREFKRKLLEFGYVDEKGDKVKDYELYDAKEILNP